MTAPIQITGQVLGAEAVQARFLRASESMKMETRDEVRRLGLELLRKVMQEKLSGQVLKVQTGHLRGSINEKFSESGSTFTSTVGTNLAYGRFWELGFHGTEQVKAHVRRTKEQMDRRAGKWGTRLGRRVFRETGPREMGMTMVRAHARRVDQNARPFLVPSLDEMRDTIKARLMSVLGRI